MIWVHGLRGKAFVINAHLIMTVEAVPDTVITLINGQKFVVRETPEEVVARTIAYRRKLGVGLHEHEVDFGARGEA